MTTANSATPEEPGSAAQRDRRRRILAATYALATEGGFDAVQMRAVADRAGVALGTLYRYFPSKIHLLVTALGRQLEDAAQEIHAREVPGATRADRVLHVLRQMASGMQADAHLTEALVRAFVFADGSVAAEIDVVDTALTSVVTHALHGSLPRDTEPTDVDVAVARVVGDLWLFALVAWATGRSTAEQTAEHVETAVRLIVRE